VFHLLVCFRHFVGPPLVLSRLLARSAPEKMITTDRFQARGCAAR